MNMIDDLISQLRLEGGGGGGGGEGERVGKERRGRDDHVGEQEAKVAKALQAKRDAETAELYGKLREHYQQSLQSMDRRMRKVLDDFSAKCEPAEGVLSASTKFIQFRKLQEEKVVAVKRKLDERYIRNLAILEERAAAKEAAPVKPLDRYNVDEYEKQSAILLAWYNAHISNPYPAKEDKIALMAQTGLSQRSLNHWFSNRRIRDRKKADDENLKNKRKAQMDGDGVAGAGTSADQDREQVKEEEMQCDASSTPAEMLFSFRADTDWAESMLNEVKE
jgi:hypothetical protein